MRMTSEDFNNWLTERGFSGLEAARQLGVSKNTVVKYRRVGAPLYIGLACAAISNSLAPWGNANGKTASFETDPQIGRNLG